MMERSAIMTTMGDLKLFGMRAAYDEILATAVKRQHEPQRVVSDLLTAELSEKQARSIKYQIAIARLPMAKEIDEFVFDGTPINETLVRDLAGGGFLAQQRNLVLIGGTGTGKTHIAVGIARACIRGGARGASSTSSTSSTSSRPKPAPAGRAASPTISPGSTSWCSTSSAICPSHNPADSCSST
jgi:DNA replication protein DnaC